MGAGLCDDGEGAELVVQQRVLHADKARAALLLQSQELHNGPKRVGVDAEGDGVRAFVLYQDQQRPANHQGRERYQGQDPADDDRSGLLPNCVEFVRVVLASPASADNYPATTTRTGRCRWPPEGRLDSVRVGPDSAILHTCEGICSGGLEPEDVHSEPLTS